MSVRIVAGELATGKILVQDVPTTENGGSWGMVLNDAGDVGCRVPLRNIDPAQRTAVKLATEVCRTFLAAVTDEGHVLEAGPVWTRKFNDKTGHLTIGAAGLWSYYDHRRVIPVLAPGARPQDALLSYSALSLGTIAKRLVQAAHAHTGGSVPVVLPADEAGTNERAYHGFELGVTGDRIKQLTDVVDGPDLAFQPRLTSNGLFVEWVMLTGTTSDPLLHQVGADWQWDRGAPQGDLRLVSVDEDGSRMAGRAWGVGAGTESAQLMSVQDDPALVAGGYPLLEVSASHTSVEDQNTLDAHTTALRDVSRRPWQTWSMETSATSPQLGAYRPGDYGAVSIPAGHVYIPEGIYRSRLLTISGDKSTTVNIDLAPTIENR